MFTRVKTTTELANLRVSGRMTAEILQKIRSFAQPGISGNDISSLISKELKNLGAKSAFKGYNGFSDVICISVNDEVVHGIPNANLFKKGDVVSFDFGVTYNDMISDSAFTMVIGEESSGNKKRLLEATEASLYAGLDALHDGVTVGDIGAAIEKVLSGAKLGIIQELVGHGVGHALHESPDIPNYGRSASGAALQAGMTVAIEPMATLGKAAIKTDDDGWTIRTRDSSLAAHFEHTVLITENGYEILTAPA